MLHLKTAVAQRRASWTFCNCGDSVECEDRGRETHIRTRAVERGSFVNSREAQVSLHLKLCFWEDYERISFRLVVFLGRLQLRDIFIMVVKVLSVNQLIQMLEWMYLETLFLFLLGRESWGLATRLQMIVDGLFSVCSQITRMWDIIPPSNALKVKSMTPCLSYSMPN